ncbi:MAG: rane protein [Aeromicrobium sp.]|nr:rane protein [Aeromicrobium sp.]
MESLAALVFSSGWASGVNAYATVAVLGLIDRFGDTAMIPDALARGDVLAISLVMFTIELVVDKIPWADSLWDAVSTVIRPTVGAWVAYQFGGDASAVDQALLTTLGGGSALASHGVKTGLRLAVNTSPEPFSNILVSTGEDVAVITVVMLAVAHPWIALGVSATLLVVGVIAVVLLWRLVRTAWRRRRGLTT